MFADPIDATSSKVAAKDVIDLLTSRGEEYWNSHSGWGMASLLFCEDDNATSVPYNVGLNLTVKDGAGIYVDHHNGDDWHFASDGEPDYSNLIRIFAGQDWFRLYPRSLFVPIEIASEVISYFCHSGGRSPNVNWIPMRAIPWAEIEKETERMKNLERKRRRTSG